MSYEVTRGNPLHTLSYKLFDVELSKHPKLAFDIGANDGGMSRVMSGRCKTIHAFEPVPDQFEKLKKLSEVECKNVVPFNLGVSDKKATERSVGVFHAWTLAAGKPDCGFAEGYSDTQRFDMALTTIDEHSRVHGKPDLIKLDVDGYEFKVLMGGIETLSKKPCPIYFEYSYYPEKFFGDSIQEMCYLIYRLGYRAWSLDGEFVAETDEVMFSHYPKDTSFDLMLLHRSTR